MATAARHPTSVRAGRHRRLTPGPFAAWPLAAWVLAAGLVLAATPPAAAAQGDPAARPDIVLILTDDQRWDTLWAMPVLQQEVVAKGLTFTNAFVVTPLCCPSRATILTGQHSHTTGVYANFPPRGGVAELDDDSTVATWLHDAGYRTGLIGRYLTDYRPVNYDYVPPGWDRWLAGGSYKGFSGSDQGRSVRLTDGYIPDVLTEEAVEFIRTTPPTRPLFLHLGYRSPHAPATPAPRHAQAFPDLEPWRPPAYDEPDVRDKPDWVRALPALSDRDREGIDRLRVDQYRTLLAVDEGVGAILRAIEERDRLEDTLLVFTSDNGFMWGEHRLDGKNAPYEESIRVPMVVRYDALALDAGGERDELVLNLDLAPTFAELAGVEAPGAEGLSLAGLLAGSGGEWRSDFLVEHMQLPTEDPVPSYCAIRTAELKYVRYEGGDEELYDLDADPGELDNLAADLNRLEELRALRARAGSLCDPPPPGYDEYFGPTADGPPEERGSVPWLPVAGGAVAAGGLAWLWARRRRRIYLP